MKTHRKIKNYIIGPISLLISILLLSSCMDKESPEQEEITIEEEIFGYIAIPLMRTIINYLVIHPITDMHSA
ncbi:hypothetical protein JYB62_09425 [Algoriphagus lutimaris]|uniref:hypothetical protein n=1 Tax=Algoriphagus lutimaris TaxID=613197 RepID=UPI00196BA818|nr:hypothetical protein [Algoriphagus lutimaris]MBN3520223.1 hypothetical protein [Algoriphagus lutimaris]